MAVLLAVGFAVDAGGKIRTIERADAVAREAARAAVDAVDVGKAQQGGAKIVDPDRAVVAALAYLATANATGEAAIGEDRTTVRVTVTLVYHTRLITMIGIDTLPVTRSATAVLLTG